MLNNNNNQNSNTKQGAKREDVQNTEEEEKQGRIIQPPKEFPHTHPNQEHLNGEEGATSESSTKDKESTSDEMNFRDQKLEEIKKSMYLRKCQKFEKVLSQKVIELDQLRALAWNGCPSLHADLRCTTWKLLLDYLPND